MPIFIQLIFVVKEIVSTDKNYNLLNCVELKNKKQKIKLKDKKENKM